MAIGSTPARSMIADMLAAAAAATRFAYPS